MAHQKILAELDQRRSRASQMGGEKKLSKRKLIKVDALGNYTIHRSIEQGAILVTQKT